MIESSSPQTTSVDLASNPASIPEIVTHVEVANKLAPAQVGAHQEARTDPGGGADTCPN